MRVAARVFVGVAVDVGVPVRLCAAPGTTGGGGRDRVGARLGCWALTND